MGHPLVFVKGYVLLLLATFPNFGESTNLTVGEEFKFTCTHDGKNKLMLYPFSNAGSFRYSTGDKISYIKIKAQTFDNGNSMKCTNKSMDGEKILKTTDVFVVRPNATVKEEFDPAVIHEHVFHENEEFEISCNYTLGGWIKVDANNVVTDGETKNGLITKKFTLTSEQFDGAKLICLKFICSAPGCERSIQKVVKFKREFTNLTVGEEFQFTCTHDGKNKLMMYPFSNAGSFCYSTGDKISYIKIKAQTFDNGSSMKCTNKSMDGEKVLKTTDVFVVRPNATVKEEFDPAVIHEHVFHENEEFEISCNYTLGGWIKVDANNVVTDGETKNGLITKKFTLTSEQFDGAKLICLKFICSAPGCERSIQKVVKFKREFTNLTVGEEFQFTCTHDGKNKLMMYPFSNAGSFCYSTGDKISYIKIKAQTFDNGNSMKCTNKSMDGEKVLKSTDVFVVRPNATVKEEFDPAVIHEHVFHENEEFEISCNYTLGGWIKVDANNVVTDGDTKNGLITKKFTLTSEQFDGAKLICLKFICSATGCERSIQKVVKFKRYVSTTTSTTLRTTTSTMPRTTIKLTTTSTTPRTTLRTTTSTTPRTTLRTTTSTTIKPTTTSTTPRTTLRTTTSTTIKPTTTITTPRTTLRTTTSTTPRTTLRTTTSTTIKPTTTSTTPRTTLRTTTSTMSRTTLRTTTSTTIKPTTTSTTPRTTLRTTTSTTIKPTTTITTPRTTLRTTTSTTTIPTTTSTSLRTTNPPAANTTTSAPTTASSTTAKPLPIITPTDKLLQNELERSGLDKGNSRHTSKEDSVLKLDVHADGDFVMFKYQGPVGPPGPAGAPGAPGAPGVPGLPGVCPVTCPVMHFYHDEIYPEGIEPGLGSEQRPAPAACRFMPATQQEGPAPDPYWVMESEKFPVKCDKATNRTCLILNHDDARWINETKMLMKPQASTWLSSSGFNLDRFNTITQNQLHWLKEQSVSVQQTIRVSVANTTFPRTNLRLLSAQDVVVGSSPSLTTPMYYSVRPLDDATITVDGEAWTFVDLVITDTARRLPIVDFHVEHAAESPDPAYISVQLRELCFG